MNFLSFPVVARTVFEFPRLVKIPAQPDAPFSVIADTGDSVIELSSTRLIDPTPVPEK